jgi:hypothetical protein
VTGPGGSQIVLDDPAGNPVELFSPPGGSLSLVVRQAATHQIQDDEEQDGRERDCAEDVQQPWCARCSGDAHRGDNRAVGVSACRCSSCLRIP